VRNLNVLEWLLEESNPSARYFTLRDILGCSESDADLRAVKKKIPKSKPVTKILSRQRPDGYWGDVDNPYIPKYKASYWQVMVLADLGMTRQDPRMRSACNYIFSFQHAEGGFSSNTYRTALREYSWRARRGKKLPSKTDWIQRHIYEGQLSCLTGNMAAALIRLGYENDPRLQRALNWLIMVQNDDGGWLCPYWSAHAQDRHGCFYGTIGPLEAFSEVSPRKRTHATQRAIEHGAEFLLMHRLFKADHHNYSIINKSWLRFGFPPFYRYNILRGLDVLTKLGYTRDQRAGDAIDVLLRKRCKDGTWVLESAPAGRMHTNIEMAGRPSKWITLVALRIMERLSGGRGRITTH